jgi:hypothetical protein
MIFSTNVGHFGREELIGREVDLAEQLAGIIRCGYALLLRNAEIIGWNQHLYVAFDLNNGKDSDGGVNRLAVAAHTEFAAIAFTNALRNSASRITRIMALTNFCRKADGFRNLYVRSY